MGQLIDGQWHAHDRKPEGAGTAFAGVVTADGRKGPDGRSFAAEAGRYHLIASYACPFAHRAMLARQVRGLTRAIGLTLVEPLMSEHGWAFLGHAQETTAGAEADPIAGAAYLHQLYQRADRRCTTRVSVPVLWDRQQNTLVSNDSASIMRMLDDAFDAMAERPERLVPAGLEAAVEATNLHVQQEISAGVMRCGTASTQAAYDAAASSLASALDGLEARLAQSPFLLGDRPTECDWRLFCTLCRFDLMYVPMFRAGPRRLVDFPKLWTYARRLYQIAGVSDTVDWLHIERNAFLSHRRFNASGIVPRRYDTSIWQAPVGRA